MERAKKQEIVSRLTHIRAGILAKYPFYGRMLMQVKFGLANCETAFTDMKRIVFDPEFLSRLSDEECAFVMNHEVLHCALKHCLRGKGLNHVVFNVACDIVVNSNILYSMGLDTFCVDKEPVMHLTPDGKEGYLYHAEEVYEMLMRNYQDMEWGACEASQTALDRHDQWSQCQQDGTNGDQWDKRVAEAAGYSGDGRSPIPPSVQIVIDEKALSQKLRWKQLLQEFVSKQVTDYDYAFATPDRRSSELDFLLPGLYELEDERYENLWFCVDTSGSVSDEAVNMVFAEIRNALKVLDNLKGKLSFFDESVSDPQPFHNVKTLNELKPKGRGGTSFREIFRYMKEQMKTQFPKAVIILTDGYAPFPSIQDTMNVPVLWVIVNSSVKPPFGEVVYVETD